jgi:hypothetical protein
MTRSNIIEPDLDEILKQGLKDDLPSEIEARMSRQFLNFKRALDQPGCLAAAAAWSWMHGLLRKEILAFASAILLILGIVMQIGGPQTVLAHSIERLKVVAAISMSLNRAAFMDCTVTKPGANGESISYRVLWRANGDARVDMVSGGSQQTMWISGESISLTSSDGGSIHSIPLTTIALGPGWQPAMEFRTPALLAKNMEEQYGLMQTGAKSGAESGEFLVVGREERQAVEITVNAKTYLPKVLKKYALDSGGLNKSRLCLVDVRFHWNQPSPGELFVPGSLKKKP